MTPVQILLEQIRRPEFLKAVRDAVPHLVAVSELSLASEIMVAICTKMDTWPPTGSEADRRAREFAQLWHDMREAIFRAEMPFPEVKTKILPPLPPAAPSSPNPDNPHQ